MLLFHPALTCSMVSSRSLLSSSICFLLLSRALMSLSSFITFPSFVSMSICRFWRGRNNTLS